MRAKCRPLVRKLWFVVSVGSKYGLSSCLLTGLPCGGSCLEGPAAGAPAANENQKGRFWGDVQRGLPGLAEGPGRETGAGATGPGGPQGQSEPRAIHGADVRPGGWIPAPWRNPKSLGVCISYLGPL